MNSEAFFKIKFSLFWDALILKVYFLIVKIINFRGDLSDISATTATLLMNQHPWCRWFNGHIGDVEQQTRGLLNHLSIS